MSRYFVLPEEGIGEGGDIYFRHWQPNFYRLFVGEKDMGFVVKTHIGWNAFSSNISGDILNSMDGFRTRLQAGFFIIKHHGYWLREKREMRDNQYEWGIKAALDVVTNDNIMKYEDPNDVDPYTVAAVIGRSRKLIRKLLQEKE
jgi:hypothetical protein